MQKFCLYVFVHVGNLITKLSVHNETQFFFFKVSFHPQFISVVTYSTAQEQIDGVSQVAFSITLVINVVAFV